MSTSIATPIHTSLQKKEEEKLDPWNSLGAKMLKSLISSCTAEGKATANVYVQREMTKAWERVLKVMNTKDFYCARLGLQTIIRPVIMNIMLNDMHFLR